MISQSLQDSIHRFIYAPGQLRSEWLGDDVMSIYMRRSRRALTVNGEMKMWEAIDFATIDVDPDHRGKGLFTQTVDHLLKVNPLPVLYVENAAEFLLPCLARRGFIPHLTLLGISSSMYHVTAINTGCDTKTSSPN